MADEEEFDDIPTRPTDQDWDEPEASADSEEFRPETDDMTPAVASEVEAEIVDPPATPAPGDMEEMPADIEPEPELAEACAQAEADEVPDESAIGEPDVEPEPDADDLEPVPAAKKPPKRRVKPTAQPRPKKQARTADYELATATEHVDDGMAWYVLKVQSNREESIRGSIERKIKIHGLEEFVDRIVVPKEKVTEIRNNKKRVVEKRFFPGYIMARMAMNDDVWFTIRETPGVGDFISTEGKPTAMTDADIVRMFPKQSPHDVAGKVDVEHAPINVDFAVGDHVRIKEGHTFGNFEGDVEDINGHKGTVRVVIQIFGRATPVDLEYSQVEKL